MTRRKTGRARTKTARSMVTGAPRRVGLALGLLALSGCAGLLGGIANESGIDDSGEPMTQSRMELLFAQQVDAIVGPPGAIQTQVDGIKVYMISMPSTDRMRIIAPIVRVEKMNRRAHDVLLKANFHATLDARYAISDGVVYAVFLHPISSLSPALLRSGLSQVLSLVRTFGSTFSSSELFFGRPETAGE